MTTITIIIDTTTDKFKQQAWDILCTAIEGGGVSYWAEGRDAKRDDDLNWLQIDLRPDRNEGAAFKKGDSRNDWQTIGVEQIAEGMRRIATGECQVRADIRQTVLMCLVDPENADHDCEIADSIIQAAMFNELVFG
jgi:hypothetical protein